MKNICSIVNNTAQSILATCSILLHLLLIIVCARSKVICKNFANFTIFQTAIADFIFCIGIFIVIINETLFYFQKDNTFVNNCILILTSLFFGYQIRDITVVFITIDRWAALKFPVFFRKIPLKTKITITFIVSQIYAFISIIIGWFSTKFDYTTKSCQSYYIYTPQYLLWFYGLSVFVTFIVVVFQLWIMIISHSMKSSRIIFKFKGTKHVRPIRIIKNDYSKIKRTMTLFLINYVVMWCLPQLAYFVVLQVNDENFWTFNVSQVQNYFNIIHGNLNILIYFTTYTELRKLFSAFLFDK